MNAGMGRRVRMSDGMIEQRCLCYFGEWRSFEFRVDW
jgi:hypothetical protein